MSWVIALRSIYAKFKRKRYGSLLSGETYLRYHKLSRIVLRVDGTMGAFLDKPNTEKSNDQGEAHGARYAVASMQGWRVDMEDAHVVEISMSSEPPFLNWSFYAVFDGHAGSKAAHHSAENLLKTLLATKEFTQVVNKLNEAGGVLDNETLKLIEDGIKSGFLIMDEKMKESEKDNETGKSGTTAICAIVTPTHFFLANLGDSRAILSRKGEQLFGTEDHKPYLPKERTRIMNAGGSVMIQRVNGSLAVSRAFGDFEYKADPQLHATEQLVSPEPDVYRIERDSKKDEFLLLACDGVYDVMTNDELCEFVQSRLRVTDDLPSVANQVLDACLSKGSRDNMTVILVCFEAAPKVDDQCVKHEEAWKNGIMDRVTHLLETVTMDDKEGYDVERLMSVVDKNYPPGVTSHAARTIVEETLQKFKAADVTSTPIAKRS